MKAMARLWPCLMLTSALASTAACGNPAVDALVTELGEEVQGVEPSEYHRPGQPCVLCHSVYGGAEPQMSVAGTVFALPDLIPDPANPGNMIPPPPVKEVKVLMFDAFNNRSPDVETNCVGNFFLTKEQWDPFFPLYAEIEFKLPGSETTLRAAMGTWIQREPSCNQCHRDDPNQGSAGRIYCMKQMPTTPFPTPTKEDCKGIP